VETRDPLFNQLGIDVLELVGGADKDAELGEIRRVGSPRSERALASREVQLKEGFDSVSQ